jgi:ZIP family zinc transporter
MDDYLMVLALALLPALGNFGGGILAEFVRTSGTALNKALHAAAGIVIAVVAVELMPEALGGGVSGWALALAFSLGGVFYLLVEWMIDRIRIKSGARSGGGGMWMIYMAVCVDLFSDGLMIGTGSAVSFGLALALAVGQVLADIPEGFATVANFKAKGVPRAKRVLLSASFAVPVLFAASLGYWLLRDQSEALKLAALIFTAGLLTVAAVEEMMTEAHESAEDTRLSVLCFVGGFALFTLVSSYFEGG